ncbi:TIGR03862 family flavoprotein [Rhizobium sp. NFR03]|uniref:TIGR03862 family flavoprotein n=1 Tax=Rhizobium sp. NFR03 TaxID=1566263 RepID=UPI001FCD63D1|nr:TIGR03862 family flavoprotein [Rhizobium sp. NFR03]
MTTADNMTKTIAIIGGGPAGLAAAEILSKTQHAVTVYDAMPTIGRKFLLAGKSGLNLTHAEPYDTFASRFGAANDRLRPALDAFSPKDVRRWAEGLGVETFVGSSGRVFPKAMKASPLLRAWRQRLETRGVTIQTRWRWVGFSDSANDHDLVFETPEGIRTIASHATVLALGGASWPRLGSDARWVPMLEAQGIAVAPFRPANCGFDVAWSEEFAARFAGAPVKSVVATSQDGRTQDGRTQDGRTQDGRTQGEFVITRHGIEGSLVYAHSAALRDRLEAEGQADFVLDLLPGRSLEALTSALEMAPRKASFSNRLRKAARIDGAKLALLREVIRNADRLPANDLASVLKMLPIPLVRPRPIEEAISSAGGISSGAIDPSGMLRHMPGVFVAGEMVDWEAPTGGYLLTACFATGRHAASGLLRWMSGAD